MPSLVVHILVLFIFTSIQKSWTVKNSTEVQKTRRKDPAVEADLPGHTAAQIRSHPLRAAQLLLQRTLSVQTATMTASSSYWRILNCGMVSQASAVSEDSENSDVQAALPAESWNAITTRVGAMSYSSPPVLISLPTSNDALILFALFLTDDIWDMIVMRQTGMGRST